MRPTSLRVIGGEWRGRRIPVAAAPGLRPTPDRVRETLFNWLAPIIAGARCLDLCAGTGALGLEALSRGAARVDFFDTSAPAIQGIETALLALGARDRAMLATMDARRALAERAAARLPATDIVFIDPPFEAGLHAPLIDALAPVTGPQTRIYVEYPAAEHGAIEALLAPNYIVSRARRAARVGYCLARTAAASEDSAS